MTVNAIQRWTAAEEAKLRKLHADGVPLPKIAAALGRTLASVRGQCERTGLMRRPNCAPRAAATVMAERRELVRPLMERGFTVDQIAAQLGLSHEQVRKPWRSLRNEGIQPRTIRISIPPPPRQRAPKVRPRGETPPRPTTPKAPHEVTVFALTTDPDEKAAAQRATAHARRTAALPPLTEDEAQRLVQEFIARKGITRIPGPERFDGGNFGIPWVRTAFV